METDWMMYFDGRGMSYQLGNTGGHWEPKRKEAGIVEE